MIISENFVIGVDFSDNKDESVVVVMKEENGVLKLKNILTGEVAEWTYQHLMSSPLTKHI